jgi:3-dehydroquinate synthetase
MRETLVLDKKSSHGVVRFVLLEKIGACCPFKGTYCSEIPSTMLDDAICWMITSFSGEQR